MKNRQTLARSAHDASIVSCITAHDDAMQAKIAGCAGDIIRNAPCR